MAKHCTGKQHRMYMLNCESKSSRKSKKQLKHTKTIYNVHVQATYPLLSVHWTPSLRHPELYVRMLNQRHQLGVDRLRHSVHMSRVPLQHCCRTHAITIIHYVDRSEQQSVQDPYLLSAPFDHVPGFNIFNVWVCLSVLHHFHNLEATAATHDSQTLVWSNNSQRLNN